MAIELLGYIFVFYIGFYFYRLGENHNKMKWLCGLLGITSYFLAQVLYLLYVRFISDKEIDEFDITNLSFKSFLVGLIFVVILFNVLNLVWNRQKKSTNEVDKKEIDKIGNQCKQKS